MKNSTLFFRSLMKYLVVLFIIIISNIYLISYSNALSKKETQKEYVSQLKDGLNNLTMQVSKMRTVSDLLACNDEIYLLKKLKSPIPSSSYPLMNSTRLMLSQTNLFFDFTDYFFLLYKKNDIFISSAHVACDFNDYYHSFLNYENLTAQEFKTQVFSTAAPFDFLSCKNLTYYKYTSENLDSPMIIVFYPHSSNDSQKGMIDESIAFTYIINAKQILHLFSLKPHQSSLLLDIFYHDRAIFSYQDCALSEDTDSAMRFEVTDPTGEYTLKASFIDTTKKKQLSYLSNTVWMYFMLGLLASITAAFFLSYKQYDRFRSLISSITTKIGKTNFTYTDEFDYIDKSVYQISHDCDDYRMQIAMLRAQRRDSILENALIYGIYTTESKQFITEAFGEMNTEFYYIALFKIITSDSEAHARIFLAAKTYIETYYNSKNTVYSTLYAGDQIIFIVSLNPNDSSTLNGTEQIFYNMGNELLKGEQFSYQTGISNIGHGIEHLHTCFLQASKALCSIKDEYKNTVALYQSIKSHDFESLISLDELLKLNDLILSNESEAITFLFKHIKTKYERNASIFKGQAAEVFYSIKTVLTNCITQLEVDNSTITLPEYYPRQDFLHQLHSLEVLSDAICHIQRGNKAQKKQEVKEVLLNYINLHYMDPGLTLAQVSQALGISESYCYQFIKEQTGTTFFAYLEQTRIRQAEHLLCHTSKNNTEIAELVGFGSVKTFYRVYKKNKGITPGYYRELHQLDHTTDNYS